MRNFLGRNRTLFIYTLPLFMRVPTSRWPTQRQDKTVSVPGYSGTAPHNRTCVLRPVTSSAFFPLSSGAR